MLIISLSLHYIQFVLILCLNCYFAFAVSGGIWRIPDSSLYLAGIYISKWLPNGINTHITSYNSVFICLFFFPAKDISVFLSLSVANAVVSLHRWISNTELFSHYNDVVMGTMASQITSLTIVYSIVYSGGDQRKHQTSAPLAFVRGIHRWPEGMSCLDGKTRFFFYFT